MLNYYGRFLPHSAAHQAPLHDVLSRPKVKGSHPITWTPELIFTCLILNGIILVQPKEKKIKNS
jgi:hypothetical protein